ncbi:hypothetical protein T492DRAFT_857102 [Pavlovales sp. CCMP2436]|nr:hypothetical protein T492DRAFT_857102 [Pavlovales sp. CCMP2436]
MRVEDAREANAQTYRTRTRKLEHLLACVAVVRVGFVPHQQTTAEHTLLTNAAPKFGFFAPASCV